MDGQRPGIESHVAPRIGKAAADAGRPAPRIVAGLPVAVHDDVDEARAVAARQFVVYGQLPTTSGSSTTAASPDRPTRRSSVTRRPWPPSCRPCSTPAPPTSGRPIFPVGDDAAGSRRRTRALLQELAYVLSGPQLVFVRILVARATCSVAQHR